MLRPGGRVALAVWDSPRAQPVGDYPLRALIELGYIEPPDPDAPGMFSLAAEERLQELLERRGFDRRAGRDGRGARASTPSFERLHR